MARVLVQKNVASAILLGDAPAENAAGQLQPGHKAGLYGIESHQLVQAVGNDDLPIWNYAGPKADLTGPKPKAIPPVPAPPGILPQYFNVQAPQFSLDPKTINTFYPPDGHQDEGRILPHIVFNDPHVPWLREAGGAYKFLQEPIDFDPVLDPHHKNGRNLVPWMALMVFDPEELLITPDDAKAIGLMDPTTLKSNVASYDPTKLPANGRFQMTVGEYFMKIPTHRIYYEAAYPPDPATPTVPNSDLAALQISTDMTNVIFPTKDLVKKLFGAKVTPNIADDSDRTFEAQKLMAHVRQVNTLGFPDAGVEEEGFFSVVISSRTGNVDTTVPKTQVVHLVSIENYDASLIVPATGPKPPFASLLDSDRVGLISLYSWTYSVIPEAVNFVDTMAAIANDMQTMKPPQATLDSMKAIFTPPTKLPAANVPKPSLQKAAKLLHDRLDLSYTMSRWRTATGEETVAFNRGPLVSTPTPTVPSKDGQSWPKLSMTGKDYQIFDQDIGVMDLTYSSAWSLGKLAAISDSPFNAALLRFRSLVWTLAASNTRMVTNGISPAATVIANTASAIAGAHVQTTAFSGVVSRLNPTSKAAVAGPLTSATVAPIFAKAIQLAVDRYASTVDGKAIYNDFNLAQAANADWELIHNWISDTLYLAHIPAHYLFPEPSHIRAAPQAGKPAAPNLPPEALRFFHIDHSWLDAFIDGALSCANHLEPDYDSTRLRIKEVYNYYLKDYITGLEDVSPPVPQFGFIFRSSVVKAIPDLKITVTCWLFDSVQGFIPDTTKTPRNPVVRLTKLDDFSILCLLDCLPEEIYEITFAQPPHQQRYAMGNDIQPNAVTGIMTPELKIRALYTDKTKAPEGIGEAGEWLLLPNNADQPSPGDLASYWDDTTRCIHPIVIAGSIQEKLYNTHGDMTGQTEIYTDRVPNSCLIGLELNDPSYNLTIKQEKPIRSTAFPKFVRPLWTGVNPDPPAFDGSGNSNVTLSSLLPSKPLVQAASIDPTKITIPPFTPTSSIPFTSPPRFNSSAVISTLPFKVNNAPGVGSIPGPQFTLIFHVDYRTPPPTPLLFNGSVVYAPLDYLPTDTTFLYDIILAIRRTNPLNSPNYALAEISIEMPISDGHDLADIRGQIREPLLPVGGYHGPGVSMVSNQRFVPTLYNTQDNAGKSVLGVKLIPRSGLPNATILLTSKGDTNEVSVRLAEVEVAPIKKFANVAVAQVGPDGKATNPPSVRGEKRGMVNLRLVEKYVMPDGRIVSMVTDGNSIPGAPGFAPVPLFCLKKDGVPE